MLVGLIPAPSAYDPAVSPEKSQTRWKRVIEREVTVTKALTPAQADAIEYPMPQEAKSHNTFSGTNGYLLRMVQDELGKDVIAIRPIMNLTLTYDHRLVDGALAGRFLKDLKEALESWDEVAY